MKIFDKQIVIIKPNSLSGADREKLTKAGHIVIEHEKWHEINFKPMSEPMEFTFTNCYSCGERIYVTAERLSALKMSKTVFYCSYGHSQAYK